MNPRSERARLAVKRAGLAHARSRQRTSRVVRGITVTRRNSKIICDLCGAEMLENHCKLICKRCGATRDCSDP